jgi:nitrite reductase/ring-hydroxylating ferredoxin subunit
VDEGWVGVLPLDELRERRSTRGMMGEEPVMLYRDADRILAIGNRCAHQGAPLDRGP